MQKQTPRREAKRNNIFSFTKKRGCSCTGVIYSLLLFALTVSLYFFFKPTPCYFLLLLHKPETPFLFYIFLPFFSQNFFVLKEWGSLSHKIYGDWFTAGGGAKYVGSSCRGSLPFAMFLNDPECVTCKSIQCGSLGKDHCFKNPWFNTIYSDWIYTDIIYEKSLDILVWPMRLLPSQL